MFNLSEIRKLSKYYNVPEADVIFISLNRYGIRADTAEKRIRFKLKLDSYEEVFYFAVCVNTYPSPYFMDKDGILYLDSLQVGRIFDIEKDTCDSTYFRRNQTELTLNSNVRSQCKGCKFCGTYNLDPDDLVDLNTKENLRVYIEKVMLANKLKSLENIIRITVCTGCFENEGNLVEHLIMVNQVMKQYGFDKRIRYIGSQLRSENAMSEIFKSIPYFSLSLSAECFSRRSDIMRKEKAELNLDDIATILNEAKQKSFSTNFLYILGLDSLDIMEKGMVRLKPFINRFPGIQVLQNFVPEHEIQRTTEATKIEYYLEARKRIEKIFGNENYKPRSWENYRGLFYLSYNNAELRSIRI